MLLMSLKNASYPYWTASQDFASKHNILRMYSGKDAAFIDTVIVPFDMIFKNAENNEYLGTRKTQCHVTTETDLA